MIKFSNLSLRYMKQHKKRNVLIIIGIALAMALITSIATLFESIRATTVQRERVGIGNYHIQVKDMKYEDVKYLENNKAIEKIALVKGTKEKNNIKVFSGDNEYWNIISTKLERGAFPKSEDEILISKDAAESIDKDFKINENLTVYNKTYKVVGFLEDELPMTAYVYSSSFNKEDNVDVYLSIAEKLKVRDEINRLKEGSLKGYEVIVNEHLLEYMDEMIIGSMNQDALGLMAVLYGLIAISAAIIIYNIFTIPIIERVREFGLLRAVGATRKQIVRMVLKEGTIIGVVSIVIGVFAGVGMVKGFMKITAMNPHSLINDVKFSVDYKMILLSIVLGIITIYLSLMVPAIKAFKITPLDAMSGSNSISAEKNKNMGKGRLAKLIFKGEGFIASKNIRRKKCKFRMSVIAMAISIILFIVVSGMSSLVLNSDKVLAGEGEITNMNIVIGSDKNKDTSKDLNSIRDYITSKGYAERILDIYKPIESGITLKTDKIGGDLSSEFKIGEGNDSTEIKGIIQCYNDDSFKNFDKFMKSGTSKGISSGNNVIVYQTEKELTGEFQKKKTLEYSKLKVDDTITIKNKEFNVIGILRTLPIHKEINLGTISVFGGEKLLNIFKESDDNKLKEVFIRLNQNNDSEEIKKEIKNKTTEYPFTKYRDMDNKVEEVKSSIWEIKALVYIFIAVISIMAALNVINSIITGILTRKREFAALAAIGMSNKGINKIVLLEGVLQCFVAWIYGTVIGLGIYYIAATLMSRSMEITITVPFKSIIISILAMLIIVILSTYSPIKRLKNMNIIEALRVEE